MNTTVAAALVGLLLAIGTGQAAAQGLPPAATERAEKMLAGAIDKADRVLSAAERGVTATRQRWQAFKERRAAQKGPADGDQQAVPPAPADGQQPDAGNSVKPGDANGKPTEAPRKQFPFERNPMLKS